MRALAKKTSAMRQHVVRLYVEERWSTPTIARAFDVSTPAVNKALRRAGVVMRSLSETSRVAATRHGHYGSRTYRSWIAMKQRCYDPKASNWKYYGARGITVCAEWREDFPAFLRDMGERPTAMSLDRIDINGHYEPGNCRWATASQQNTNRRSWRRG